MRLLFHRKYYICQQDEISTYGSRISYNLFHEVFGRGLAARREGEARCR